MILHHYDISPYSEKIRLMLGYTGLKWQSAISPPMPPRDIVDPLVGGYRRIPIGQIGADLFCDTRIIVDEIAAMSGKPELSFESVDTEISEYALGLNRNVFMPVVQTAEPLSALIGIATKYWPWQIAKLLKDRANMGRKSKLPRMKRKDMLEAVQSFKADIDQRLEHAEFLFGDSPNIADFTAYHLVWFGDFTRSKPFLNSHSHARAWQQRMTQFGHGDKKRIHKAKVHQIANDSEPRPLPVSGQLEHELLGSKVSIRPSDYARTEVVGTLVSFCSSRYIIARNTPDYGLLHVHFPVEGYQIKKI